MRPRGRETVLLLAAGAAIFLFAALAGAAELARDTDGQNEPCLGCHRSANRILAHRSLQEKDIGLALCLQCHEPHSSSDSGGAGANALRRPPLESCVACHYQYSSLRLASLAKAGETIHNPVARGACADCHGTHELGEKPALLAQGGDLCLSCHQAEGGKLRDKYRHAPFAGKQCTSCHDPHLSGNKRLLLLPTGQLCESCHLDRERASGAAYPHRPYERGLCTSCHDPHASNNARQLAEEPGKLCFSCHADRKGEARKAVSHPPFASGECFRCHNPHAGRGPQLIRAGTTEELCFSCHEQLRASFAQPSRHPVGTRLRCTSCHTPHAGDFRKLLNAGGNNLCLFCHEDKGLYYGKIGHSKIQLLTPTLGSCANCHLPHGSAFKPLLVQSEIDLCLSCHPRMGNLPFIHPVGGGYLDPDKKTTLTCTTTCHDPHGTAFKYSVTKKGDGLCLTCHLR